MVSNLPLGVQLATGIKMLNSAPTARNPFQSIYFPNNVLRDTKYITPIKTATRIGDSSVGIATRYVLDGPGIEYRLGRNFPHLPRPALGPTQPPVQWVPGLSRG